MATRCTMALVDPPSAMTQVIAFSKAFSVKISEGFRSSQTISTIRRPVRVAMRE